MAAPVRHLVLDTEAVSALLSSAPGTKHAAVITSIASANGQRVVPAAVRGEAGWDRTDPATANANRLVRVDDPLDGSAADRITQLRKTVPRASVVDAAVAVAAERLAEFGGVVQVLSSDVADMRRLAAQSRHPFRVIRL
jgi:hypothetical protein